VSGGKVAVQVAVSKCQINRAGSRAGDRTHSWRSSGATGALIGILDRGRVIATLNHSCHNSTA